MDRVRHHWAPQLRPNRTVEPSTPEKILLQPDCYIPHAMAPPTSRDLEVAKQNESHIFPLSAFLAVTRPLTPILPVGKPSCSVFTGEHRPERSSAEAPSTSMQEFVASACQTPAFESIDAATFEGPHAVLPSFPLPAVQPSVSSRRQAPQSSQGLVSPPSPSPFPTTSPHIASPILTPSAILCPSAMSVSHPPKDSTIDMSSEDQPQLLPAHSMIGPGVSQETYQSYGHDKNCPSSLQSTPMASGAILDEALGYAFFNYRGSKSLSCSEESSMSVEDFLKLGHANPCWCSHCPNAVPLGGLPNEKSMNRSSEESTGSAVQTHIRSIILSESHTREACDNDLSHRKELRENNTAYGTETVEHVATHRHLPSSEYDLLSHSVQEPATPANFQDGSEDGTWTIVSACGSPYANRRASSPGPQGTASLSGMETESEAVSLATASPALSKTSWVIPPFEFELGSPRQRLFEASRPASPPSPLNLCDSPTYTPIVTPILPSTPPPTSVHSPRLIRRSSSAARSDGALNLKPSYDQSDFVEQSGFDTGFAEWSTLHRAASMNQRSAIVGLDMEDDEGNDWLADTNWLI